MKLRSSPAVRLFLRALLALLWLCDGCNGDDCGPTSDWPNRSCSTGDKSDEGGGDGPSRSSGDDGDNAASGEDDESSEPQASGDDDTSSGPPKQTPTGRKDAGAKGSGSTSAMDAASAPASGGSAPSAGDAGVPDAGPQDGSGGPYRSCSTVGRVLDAGLCDGGACMSMAMTPAGACLDGPDLALACDGEIGRVVADCAESEILRLGMGRTVASCARREPALSAASTACIDCYVDEVLCAAAQCFVPCLAGLSEECRSCRLANCGEALQTCSGLYLPPELTNPRGFDAGF